MNAATVNASSRRSFFRKIAEPIARMIDEFSIAEKIYGIVTLLMVATAFLLALSVQSVRIQTSYRHLQAAAASEAINIGRVNGLIYAIVMESRGIYMSTDPAVVKSYADELLRRNGELAGVMAEWEQTVQDDDTAEFAAFKQRIQQFIKFRKELARRATEISPAAAREWDDADANRPLRTQLNVDLEALAKIYAERANAASDLGDRGRYAAWCLFALRLAAMLLAALNVVVFRRSIIRPLSEITLATAQITAGKIDVAIPFTKRRDELGHLSRAVRNFRDTVGLNAELRQLELGTAQQRDAAIDQRDKFSEKYHETKWQLFAAIKTIPQGLIMLDGKATVLAINDQYRQMYRLPPTIKAGSTLEEILQHRVGSGLFTGDMNKYLAAIIERIRKRKPSSDEISLSDGRAINVEERAMDGGGWVAIHADVTEQRKKQRILERTERFLATVIENIAEGIIAKDARNLRYVFLNKAAEQILGMKRAEAMGKTARELFPAAFADIIERRDRQMIAQKEQLEPMVDTIENPVKGLRTVVARRLQIGGADEESHLFVTLFEDRTEAPGGGVKAA